MVMMDELCPNRYFLACRVFAKRISEFTHKYQYSLNNLLTDFMNLLNQIFLLTNCSL